MKTSELFKNKTVLSMEVFPPKRTAPVETIYQTLDGLKTITPDFISVTYGAGGSENSRSTIEIAAAVRQRYGIESVAHIPCLNLSREDVAAILGQLKNQGIENILALRGDRVPGVEPAGEFRYASELVRFIKEHGDFNIIGACYPEGHQESGGLINDMHYLKAKVDAGVSHLITQLFFDNESFYRFRERMGLVGIDVPVEAGIMPVVNKKQIERMVSLCGVKLPKKFVSMMERYEGNAEAMRDAGIAYAVDQIVDLTAHGVDGIHLYTMNNAYIANKIHDAVFRLMAS